MLDRCFVDKAAVLLSLVREFGPRLRHVEQFELCLGIAGFAGKANAGQRTLAIQVRTHRQPRRSPEPEKCPAAMRQNRGGMMVFRPQMPESVSFEMKRPPWYRAAFSNPTLGYAAQIPAIWHRRSDAA